MDKKQEQLKKEQRETLKLIGILSVGVFILLILSIVLMNSLTVPTTTPEPKYVDIDNIEGMNLSEARALLEKADITYEIIPSDSYIANKVEKLEFVGVTLTDTGRLRIRIGTSVKIYANEVDKDKVIYLTFDDGPTRDNTDYILETLAKYNIKASFFVEGQDVALYPEKMLATYEAGHVIGCHSYSHVFADVYASTDAFLGEVAEYEQALKNALGEEYFAKVEKLIRFPGGTNNSLILEQNPKDYIAAVRQNGYKVYDWTALTGDTENKTETDDMIEHLMTTLAAAKNKNQPLIALMHDKWPVKENDSLSKIIDKLISEGYYFDTIDNCPEFTFVEN
ncbi:MAG: polysaccharide deacetylase family protein [Clostridia bacterium]|nr:polysaccharide deacetylase family protein [Clostridia bacterium]